MGHRIYCLVRDKLNYRVAAEDASSGIFATDHTDPLSFLVVALTSLHGLQLTTVPYTIRHFRLLFITASSHSFNGIITACATDYWSFKLHSSFDNFFFLYMDITCYQYEFQST